MKKIAAVVLVFFCGLAAWADESATLNFYDRMSGLSGTSYRQDRKFASVTAREIAQWEKANEADPNAAQALNMQANFHMRAGEYDRALLALYQLRYYFPQSVDVTVLSRHVEEAAEELNHSQKAEALKLLAVDTSSLKTLPQRKAELLTRLVEANLQDMYVPVCELFEEFLAQNSTYPQADKVTLLLGDWHRQNGNYPAAVLEYRKVYELFPQTVYKAASLRLEADVYGNELKEPARAAVLYKQILKTYPDTSERGIIYKHLAILEENRKNYTAALENYNQAISFLGAQPSAYEAWQGKTDVLLKLKQYRAAYDNLVKGADVFASDENKYVSMLSRAADIMVKYFENPALETAALDKILLAYPQTHQAPQFMYQAGQAYEKQEKKDQAIDIYKRLVINYPTDKYASRAQRRLNKLMK